MSRVGAYSAFFAMLDGRPRRKRSAPPAPNSLCAVKSCGGLPISAAWASYGRAASYHRGQRVQLCERHFRLYHRTCEVCGRIMTPYAIDRSEREGADLCSPCRRTRHPVAAERERRARLRGLKAALARRGKAVAS